MEKKSKAFDKKKIASAISCMVLMNPVLTLANETHLSGQSAISAESMDGSYVWQSLERSMNSMRESSGVVNVVSAEQLTKLPDTSVAASLQRIAGVSFDRSGEGELLSVRGIGPNYNQVTFNGRTVPGAVHSPAEEPSSRAFDFASFSPEGVSALEVHKTSKASIASGGLGAVINVRTLRPFDNPGLNLTVGAKAIHDTTNISGRDITPEAFGLLSWTNDSETFGAAFSGSQLERDSANVTTQANDWQLRQSPSEDEAYYLPADLRYATEDKYQKRTNAHLTLQYRPLNRLTATLDYMSSNNSVRKSFQQRSLWFDPWQATAIEFNERANRVPSRYTETYSSEGGVGAEIVGTQNFSHMLTSFNSAGIELVFDVNESLSFIFDYHQSSANNRPKNRDYSLLSNMGSSGYVIREQSVDWSRSNPVKTLVVDEDLSMRGEGYEQNDALTDDDFTLRRQNIYYSAQKSEIEQLRLNGIYQFSSIRLDFGIEQRSNSNQSIYESMDSMFLIENAPGAFNAGANVDQNNRVFTDTPMVGAGLELATTPNRLVEEDINAAYIQVNFDFELSGINVDLLAGVRYEDTELTSTAPVRMPTGIRWEAGNNLDIRFSPEFSDYTRRFSYNNLLPSVDLSISPVEDVIVRASYSKTMARALHQELRADTSILREDLYQKRASAGNPQLQPVESDNFDVSLEWYYGDNSYASIGYFRKDVQNIIAQGQLISEHFGLRDVRRGPRFQEALDQVIAEGGNASQEQRIWEQAMDNAGLDINDPNQALVANEDDPLLQWITAAPVNNRDQTVQGFELALQHRFSDTGFGLQANYTAVNSSPVLGSTARSTNELQAIIQGSRDTANLVLFYQRQDLHARLAYSWSDKYSSYAGAGLFLVPSYIEAYSQIDVDVNYTLTDNLSLFAEILNLTGESRRRHGQSEAMLLDYWSTGARYQLGFRYRL